MSYNKSLLVIIIVFVALICVQQIERNPIECHCDEPKVIDKNPTELDEKATSKKPNDYNIKKTVEPKQEMEPERKILVNDENKITNQDKETKSQKLEKYFLEYWNSVLSGYVYHLSSK